MNGAAPTIATALERTRRTHAQRTALVCEDRHISYSELASRCERVGPALASLGLGPGDRVAILAANCHRYVEAYMSIRNGSSTWRMNPAATIARYSWRIASATSWRYSSCEE